MSNATTEERVDEARDALVDDVQELKAAGTSALADGKSRLPWLIGGAAGLVVAGLGVRAMKPRRRELFATERPSLFGKAIRAAALAVTGILARRYIQRVVDRALPESQDTRGEASAR